MFLNRAFSARPAKTGLLAEINSKTDYLAQLAESAAQQDLSQDSRVELRSVAIGLTTAAAVFVALRFWTRYRQTLRIWIDDYLVLFALALLVGNMVMNLQLVEHGLGLHSGALDVSAIQTLSQLLIGAEILYVTAINAFKMALLSLFFRLFPRRSMLIGGYVCGGTSTAWNLACVVAAAVQCRPLNKVWEPWVEGTCISHSTAQMYTAIPSLVCDVLLLGLALRFEFEGSKTWARTLLYVVLFLPGLFVVFAGAWRFRLALGYDALDVSYTSVGDRNWGIIEIGSGIIVASLPPVLPLLRSLIQGSPLREEPSLRPDMQHVEPCAKKNQATVGGSRGNFTSMSGDRSRRGKSWSQLNSSDGGGVGDQNGQRRSHGAHHLHSNSEQTFIHGIIDSQTSFADDIRLVPASWGDVRVTVKSTARSPRRHWTRGIGSGCIFPGCGLDEETGDPRIRHTPLEGIPGDGEVPLTVIWQHREVDQRIEAAPGLAQDDGKH